MSSNVQRAWSRSPTGSSGGPPETAPATAPSRWFGSVVDRPAAGRRCAHQPLDVARGERRTEEKSLHLVTAAREQERRLIARLHPFGDDLHTQAAGQRDHGVDDLLFVGGGADPLHERLIDLEAVERDLGQVPEPAVPGAEVVDRAPDTDVEQVAHRRARGLQVQEEAALGDLELEQVRRDAVAFQGLGDAGVDFPRRELLGREIDRDRNLDLVTPARPGADLATRLFEDPAPERNDESRSPPPVG